MYNFYLYSVAFICFLLVILLAMKILFRDKNKVKIKRNTLKKIEELKKNLTDNFKDYNSMHQLALLEDEAGDYESALDIYERLVEVGYLRDFEELQICKRLEDKYDKLNEKEKSFTYSSKIIKLEPGNIFYIIKIGTILGENGYNLVASNYFNKALLSKNEFELESLKVAAFCFFNIKDYNKSIMFLEEFYKRILKYSNRDLDEIYNIEKSLISMYIISDKLNIAKYFIEKLSIEKNISDDFRFYINKTYLFILYKLGDNERFKRIYDSLYDLYLSKGVNINYADLILDYSFYSYFLREMELSIKYFETIESFNETKFNIYNINTILKYLYQINKANYQLSLLRNLKNSNNNKYINDNYEKYIDKENIETWENSINIWEQSFLDLSYISNLIQIEKTVNIDGRILEDLKNAVDSNESRSAINITKKVDKIYDLDINEFKKLCKNIITTKLSYIITQEYEDKFNDTNKDELNFLAYDVKGSKRELTLISFKRWRKTSIGELMVRDFFMLINEVDAKNGILIVPNELSNSARSYVFHNDRIIVYARDQFNNLLNNLIKD